MLAVAGGNQAPSERLRHPCSIDCHSGVNSWHGHFPRNPLDTFSDVRRPFSIPSSRGWIGHPRVPDPTDTSCLWHELRWGLGTEGIGRRAGCSYHVNSFVGGFFFLVSGASSFLAPRVPLLRSATILVSIVGRPS